MSKLTYKVEKMYVLPEAGALKGFVDVSVNDELVIRGCRIVEGKKGIFISMPQEQGKDNKWYDQVVLRSAEAFEALSTAVMEHYNRQRLAGAGR